MNTKVHNSNQDTPFSFFHLQALHTPPHVFVYFSLAKVRSALIYFSGSMNTRTENWNLINNDKGILLCEFTSQDKLLFPYHKRLFLPKQRSPPPTLLSSSLTKNHILLKNDFLGFVFPLCRKYFIWDA